MGVRKRVGQSVGVGLGARVSVGVGLRVSVGVGLGVRVREGSKSGVRLSLPVSRTTPSSLPMPSWQVPKITSRYTVGAHAQASPLYS